MTKDNQVQIMWFAIFLLVIGILGLGIYINNLQDVKCPELKCEYKEEAMVWVEVYDWGYNEDNPEELLFDYIVYNYGKVEATNIKVSCSIFEDGITKVYTPTDNFGNLASKSAEFGEFTPPKPNVIDYDKEYSPVCYVESCDNCKILWKEIPELVETYK